jgi:ribose-phosphate pyrophosphokinase
MDLHAQQIQGFFDIPVDHLYAFPVIASYFRKKKLKNLTVVSPDVGGIKMARAYAKALNADLAIVDKRRSGPGKSEVANIIGDVAGRRLILFDDIVDSAGTLCSAAKSLIDAGAKEVSAYVTHGVLSGAATERVRNSVLKELVITDSIDASDHAKPENKIRQVSCASLIGEAIRRIANEESVSKLFD